MNFFKKNKILSIISFLLLLITLLTLVDMLSIETKYVNQPTLNFKVDNVRNPQLKKIVKFLDKTYGVEATVLRHVSGPKVRVYKMRPKKKTRKTFGSRRKLTRVLINSIYKI